MLRGQFGDARLLDLIGEVMGLVGVDEFRPGVLSALRAAVPSEWASLNELTESGEVAVIVEPELSAEWQARFAELAYENPLYQRHARTGDGRAYRFCDVVRRAELEATRLYREFYLPLGIRHQIAFTLPAAPGRVLAIALSRGDPEYADDERDFLNRARPYLIQAYRNAIAYSAAATGTARDNVEPALVAAGLTPREAEVARMVALGASNRDIAERLDVSARTVQKHLERIFPKLDVASRSAAAGQVWAIAAAHVERLRPVGPPEPDR